MTTHRLFILDVFAEEKYAGNPLAVVTGGAALAGDMMQRIAREMNFSETTFVLSDAPRRGRYDVRIFTPTAEIPFAGHPALGTAHVIRHILLAEPAPEITLNLPVGPVRVTFTTREDGAEVAWLHTSDPDYGPTHPPEPLAELLGIAPEEIDTRFPIEEVSLGVPFTIIPLKTLDALKRARYSEERLERLRYTEFARCLFLVSPETYAAESDLNVRLFADDLGVPEDPATGSATACLGGYLLRHHYFAGDRIDLCVEQGHEIGRPSLLYLRAERAGRGTRISVGGRVIMTVRGELV